MLNDQSLEELSRKTCMVGESVFYDPKFVLNYELAGWFKAFTRLHELFSFAYIAEPDWRTESLDLKTQRREMLLAFGCPLILFPGLQYGLSPLALLRMKADYIYAPHLFAHAKKLTSTAVLHSTTWVMEANSSTQARINAFNYLAESQL